VRTELGLSQVEVQQCALSWEVGEEFGEELARRKLRWKLMQTWSRRNWRRRRRRMRRTALVKSNNPHLAGGEISISLGEREREREGEREREISNVALGILRYLEISLIPVST